MMQATTKISSKTESKTNLAVDYLKKTGDISHTQNR
jgi:hypothetical protein